MLSESLFLVFKHDIVLFDLNGGGQAHLIMYMFD